MRDVTLALNRSPIVREYGFLCIRTNSVLKTHVTRVTEKRFLKDSFCLRKNDSTQKLTTI